MTDLDPNEILKESVFALKKLQREIKFLKQKNEEPIAIVGMSCRFPGGANTPEAYWNLLHRRGDAIREVPPTRWDADSYYDPNPETPGKMITKRGGFLDTDVSLFDAEFFGISPREAQYLDPQQRLLLELCYEAIQSAGIEPVTLEGTQTGVFIGICSHDYIDLLIASGDKNSLDPFMGTGNTSSTATGRISFVFDFQGPNFAVDTACSSSLVAIDQACESLRNGTASLALAGGVNLILNPDVSINFSKAGMLAPDGHCKTFDASADGYVRGEGCGIIVLKRYSDAIRDRNPVLAIIKSSGINQDGASSGLTVPNGEAQEALINTVLSKAKLKGSDIDYIEAHGTGTSLGDPIEVRAIKSTYGVRDADHPLRLGSVKTNIGHLEAAAGIAGVIKTVLALQHETIPANLHFNRLNPHIDLNFPAEVPIVNYDWKRGERVRRAAVSSFGFSGTNAHLIIEEAPLEAVNAALPKIPVCHQFRRKHYWVESAIPGAVGKLNAVHPLLGQMHQNPNNTISFYGGLQFATLPYLKEHQVYDYIIYPGAGYLEMMLAAAWHGVGKGIIELTNVSIESALNLPVGKKIDTHILMTPLNSGYEVTIYTQEIAGSWNSNAGGTASAITVEQEMDSVDIEALKSRLAVKIPKDEFYSRLNSGGIKYGTSFQTLDLIHVGNQEALGELTLSLAGKGYLAHPALLDGCLQLLAIFKPNENTKDLYLPIGCDSFKLYAPLEDHIYAYWKETEITEFGLSGNLQLLSPKGQLLASIQRMNYRKSNELTLKKMLARELKTDDWMYEWIWQEHTCEAAAPPIAFGHWLIVGNNNDTNKLIGFIESQGGSYRSINQNELPETKEELVTLLDKQNPVGILHFANSAQDVKVTVDTIRNAQILGSKTFLHITQALVQLNRKIPLFLINDANLVNSPLNGLFKTVFLEHPEIGMKSVTLEMDLIPEILLNILFSKDEEAIYKLREGRIYVPRLLRQKDAKAKRRELIRPLDDQFRLQSKEKGLLENLTLVPLEIKDTLASYELEIDVRAAGINVSDVLDALGLYPENAGPLGSDGSGVITRVGQSVKDFHVGDAVLGLISGSFARKAYAHHDLITLKSSHLTFEEAAALPTVFLTAYYAFSRLTKLKPSDTVLIHAGTGGVDQAAIQLAKLFGATIIATAGDEKEKEFLKAQGIKHVFDSRTLSFSEDVKKATNGRGVDVVLNSLTGEGFIEASLNLCNQGARFLEISKLNIWTKEQMQTHRPDIDYHVIDLDTITATQHQIIKEMLDELMPLFEQSKLSSVPITTYPIERAIQAFEDAKHIGKVVVTLPLQLQLEEQIRSDATYLITGGFGGIGKVLTKFLVQKGARHIVLTGRRKFEEFLLEDIDLPDVAISYESIDVSNEQAVDDLLKRLSVSAYPLKGIFHLAGVIDDATLMEQDWKRFETVFAPKVYGSFYLHQYSKDLDFFVLFSSAASVLGSPGQSNYAAANAFMDGLCEYRKENGLAALSLSWGPWSEIGLAKDLVSRHAIRGMIAISPKDGMRAFEAALSIDSAHTTIVNIDKKLISKQMINLPSWLEAFEEQKISKSQLSDQLEAIEKGERLNFIKRYVGDNLKEVIGIATSRSIDEKKGFASMGLDSMLAVELKNRLQAGIGKRAILATTAIFDHSTVEKLSEYIAQLLKVENIEVRKHSKALISIQTDEPIAIIGMSCRFPGGANDPEAFWKFLQEGRDGISEVPVSRWDADSYYDPDPEAPNKMITKRGGFLDFDISLFDAEFFGISPREAEYMDPQQRLLLEVTYEAMESADIEPASLQGTQTGVFVGMSTSDYASLLAESNANPYIGTGNAASAATGRISYIFDFQGPNFAIDTACSSSLVAIDQACESLRNGTSSLAFAGGVNLMLTPQVTVAESKSGMLSPDGRCKTFDASADGFVRGEGCGIILLKRYSEALADGNHIFAVIKSSGINQDGASSGLTVPNGAAQEALLNTVLAKAKLKGSDIDYIEAHGTGTSLGDPIEVRAIGSTYGVRDEVNPLKLGSIKTNIGHLEAAAGIAGVIKTVLALQHETIPPNLHFNHLNPHIEMNFPVEIITNNREWKRGEKTRRAAVSSFGFSGTNAHLIIEEAPQETTVAVPAKIQTRHQFQRKRYWVEEAIPGAGRKYKSVHPLLGEMHKNPNSTTSFYGELLMGSVPYLKDYRVYDYIIYPAAGYLEMMLAAVRHGLGSGMIELKDISIESALNLSAGKTIETHVLMNILDASSEVTIYTKANEGSWNTHAKGIVSLKNSEEVNSVDIEALKSRLTSVLSKEEFYTKLNSSGIKNGTLFQTLDQIHVGDQEVLGDFSLSASVKGYLAHPALLEGCLQLMAVSLSNDIPQDLYMPIGCDSFKFYAPLEDHIYAHWQQTKVTDVERSGNLQLFNSSGKLLVTIEGMHYRKTTLSAIKKLLSHQLNVDEWMYEWVWQEYICEQIDLPVPFGHLLILGDEDLSKQLIQLVESKGGTCRALFKAELPKTKEEFLDLLEKENPVAVLHLAISKQKGELTTDVIRYAQGIGTQTFLQLIQALSVYSPKVPLVLISDDALENSPLNGLFKTASIEHPEIAMRQIQLGMGWNPEILLNVIFSKVEEEIFALKEGKIYVPRLARQPALDKLATENQIRLDATYLITGGLGGLGQAVAKFLVEKGARHIVLTGRRKSEEILQIDDVTLTYESLDMSDEQAVVDLMKRLSQSPYPLKGIFHLAGVLDDATLMEQNWSRFETVFAPKVYGSYYLHKYSKDLDFFVLFSSVASVLGSPGQSNYAAANAFMDALCGYRKVQGLNALSLSWGSFAEVGMAKDLAARHARGGMIALKPKDGMRALEAALLSSKAHLAIANMNWKIFLKQTIAVPSWLNAFTEQGMNKENLSTQLEAIAVDDRLNFIRAFVSLNVKETLKISPLEPVDEKKGFADLGFDSLMAIELKNRLQSAIGKQAILETTALFDYSSVEKLSEHIAQLLRVENIQVRKRSQAMIPVQPDEEIAIIGMSCRFPGGANDPEAFWELMHQGKDGIVEVPASRWDADSYYDPDREAPGKMITKRGGFLDIDVSLFDAEFFGISPREAEFMDPQHRLLLELSYEAIESAGIEPSSLQGTQTGVFIGISSHEYSDLLSQLGDENCINAYIGTGNASSTATGRISYIFDFQGPNFAVDTACSSSLVAIDQACESLRNGTSSLAFAGGVNLMLTPQVTIAESKSGMLSPDGRCKTFDASADGFVRGEGCGIILLKRYSEALADGNHIFAVIKSSGINQDGASSGLTVPNGAAQEALLNTVLAKAKLKGSDIDYIEAHGTGTSLGDPIEVRAIGSTYGIRDEVNPLKLGSIKTNIGHLEAAAGIAGVIKTVLALQHETIPPNLHFNHLNPHIEMNFPVEIITNNREWNRGEKTRRAAVSSFGFSGTNAHLIIEEAPLEAVNAAVPEILVRHQFQRKRYWVEEAIPGAGRKYKSVHPLLGEMHKNPNSTISFYGELLIGSVPYLKDYRVYDYIIYPAAGYLEMMLAAGRHGLGYEMIELKDISIESALNLSAGKMIETHVLMNILDASSEVTIYTKANEGSWNTHAKGIVSLKNSEEVNSVDIEALKSRLTSVLSKEEFYTKLNSSGLNEGALFQTLNHIHVGDQEVLGDFSLSASVKGYLAHPALLEGCLQLMAISLSNDIPQDLYLPMGCDSLKFYAPLEDHIYAHWQQTKVTDVGRSGNLQLCNSSGKLLVSIEGMHYRKTTLSAIKKLLSHQLNVDEWMYEWLWQEYICEQIDLPVPFGHLLILGDEDLSKQLIQLVESKGGTCRALFKAELPKTKEEFLDLLEKENPVAVLHLAISKQEGELTTDVIRYAQGIGTQTFLQLIQALSLHNPKVPLVLISDDALENSPLNGLFKTASIEHPEIAMRQIQLGMGWNPEILLNVIFSKIEEEIFVLKEGKIYVPRLARQPALDKLATENQIRSDATYLITGGLGGLGQAVAKFLVEKGARHIVLTGRRKSEEILQIDDVTLTYESLDMSDEQAVVDLMKRLSQSPYPLKGIFHLAGVTDRALLIDQNWLRYENVFAPKVYGSFYLHQYSKDLDFFVMFSSIASSLGIQGQSNYSAANAFMDALCDYRKQKGMPALSISWGPWSEVGMAKGRDGDLVKGGLLAIKPQDGLRALEAALFSSKGHLTIANMNWKIFLKPMITVPSWLNAFAEQEINKENLSTQLEAIAVDDRLNFIKAFVSANVKETLKISPLEPLDEKKGFADLGFDSLMALELKYRLQSAIGKQAILVTTALFDYSSVEKLSEHIAQLLRVENIQVRKRSQAMIPVQPDEEIAIIGMSCRFPGGANDPEAFWELLHQGKDGIVEVPASRWDADSYYDPDREAPGKMITKRGGFLDIDVSLFDAEFFGISPREAEFMDPQHRLLLELSYEAIESAGIEPSSLQGTQTGVFIGISSHEYSDLLSQLGDENCINAYIGTGNVSSTATGRISYVFDFQGPNFAVDTACSSSLVAIDQACVSLRTGAASLALAGGVNLLLSPYTTITASKAGMLSPDGHCKTFDASADGYVRSEGCAIILLKRYSDAIRDGNQILAVIKSSGINQDGASSGLTVPNGEAQEALINHVLAKAKLKGSDIDYIEAHGTGTSLGDPIEVRAIGSTYGVRDEANPLKLGSVKSNIGHLEAAAGIAGVIKTVLALQHETIPPNLHFNHLNPHIEMNFPVEIITNNREWNRGEKTRRAAVSSFGFSGTNAHLIIEEAPQETTVAVPAKIQTRHQFQRKQYWAVGAITGHPRQFKQVHPLLGLMNENPNDTISFNGELQFAALPYLKEHQVYDFFIYPGAGYLEMMLAAARNGLGDGIIELTHISIESALNLPVGKKIETQVLMSPLGSGYEVEVFIRTNTDSWNTHAKGMVSVSKSEQSQNFVDIPALKSRLIAKITKEEFYTCFDSSGIKYGRSFQTLDQIHVGDQEALGELNLSVSGKGYLAHPTLLDGCLQLLAVSFFNENTNDVYLPVGCESFKLYAPLEDHIFAYWQSTAKTDFGRTSNLQLISPNGQLLAVIQGMNYRKSTSHTLKEMLVHESRLANWMYEWVWQEHAFKEVNRPNLMGHWLVFSDGDVSKALMSLIESSGGSYKCIPENDIPNAKQDFVSLLQEECFAGIIQVVKADKAELLNSDQIKEAQIGGSERFLYLIQALLQLNLKTPLFLINHINLVNSPLNGLFKTILLEHPDIEMKHIQLGESLDPEALFNALFAKDDEAILALKDGKIYIPRLLRQIRNKPDESVHPIENHIHPDATYLITGGLGGLGKVLTEFLVQKGARHIVLTGRRNLRQEDKESLQIADVDLSYEPMDVGDEEAVKNLITRLTLSSKPLKGIFHLAAVLDDALVENLDWSRFEKVFSSKVYGSFFLHKYSKDLDFFVLFSSTASVVGSPGQGNYAAANAFMDALCEYRKEKELAALSLAWGPWSEIGLAKDLASRNAAKGMMPLSPNDGMRALEAVLFNSSGNILIANINQKLLLKLMIAPPSWLRTFAEQTPINHLSDQLKLIDVDDRLNFIKKYVGDTVKAVLGIAPSRSIDEKKGFASMGLDSMLAVELKNKLQAAIGKKAVLATTVIFDHSSVDRLSYHIAKLLKVENIQSPKREQAFIAIQPDEPIAIIGMSCRFPGGANDPEAFWEFLHQGKDGVVEVPASRWDAESYYDPDPAAPGKMITKQGGFLDIDVSLFDAEFFGISPREAVYMDPQQRLLLELSYEAIVSAHIDPSTLQGTQTGVFIGMFNNDYMILLKGSGEDADINLFLGSGNAASAATGRISYIFDFQGPNFAIDTACSSSLVAVDQACQSLRNGTSTLAIAGGVNLMLAPEVTVAESKSGMLSPDGRCKTFDASANGFVRGEGCGMILLKRYSEAIRDGNQILAVIKSSGTNQDGASSGLTVPNGEAQEALINAVLARSKLKGADIDYIEAHGTGTALGDPIEVRAIGSTYGIRGSDHPLRLGSVKTNIGHLEAAAGIAGIIKTVLALQHETIPPNLHFNHLNPHIELNFPAEIVTTNVEWKRGEKIRRAAVSSFGFSGTNAHLIIEEAPLNATVEADPKIPANHEFQRKRYWAEAAIVGIERKFKSIHPLLGEMHKNPNNTISFYGELFLAAQPYLKDYRVYDYTIYPEAGYLEMMLAAARYGKCQEIIELKNVSIESLLHLPVGKKVETQVSMSPLDSDYEVAIYTQSDTWNIHAKGTVSAKNTDDKINPFDIKALKSRFTSVLSKDEFYNKINAGGFRYGLAFQTLTLIYVGNQEVLGELSVNVSNKDYLAHPTLLDGCLQLFYVSLVNQNEKGLYLPVGCESFKLYAPLEDHIFAYWQETESVDSIRSGNLQLLSPSGSLLAVIKGMHYRKMTSKMIAHEHNVQDWFYQWMWQEHIAEEVDLPVPMGHWLILGKEESALKLRGLIESKGGSCRSISNADLPKTGEGFADLLDKENLVGILHLVHDGKRGELTTESICNAQVIASKSFLHLCQALIQLKRKIPLILITDNNLADSTLKGLFKAVLLEHPELEMKYIESVNWDPEMLLKVFCTKDDEAIFRLEKGKSYVQRLQRYELTVQDNDLSLANLFRPDATYLITDALSSRALALAHWLIKKGVKHLAFAGSEENKSNLLTDPEISNIDVTYESVDITNELMVKELIKRLTESAHPLKGVFHLGDELGDALISDQNWSNFENVFASKVYGTYYLHKFSKDLEFFVIFSSATSVLGVNGKSSYAAANAFIETLCDIRKELGLPAISLSCGPWTGAGMEKELISAKGGMIGIHPNDGIRAFEAALLSSQTHLIIANMNWKNLLKPMIAIPSWLQVFSDNKLNKGALITQLEVIHPLERFNHMKKYVGDTVKEVLGLSSSESIEENKEFFDLGFDSLMAVDFKNKLQAAIGKRAVLVTKNILEYSTVEKISQHLAQLLDIEKMNAPQKAVKKVDSPVSSSKWIVTEAPLANPKFRVFCFPGAGTGPSLFKSWQKMLPPGVEVSVIQLPGREGRFSEPFVKNMKSAVFAITHGILNSIDTPYVFIAHSMGCLVASEVVNELQSMQLPLPKDMILVAPPPEPYSRGTLQVDQFLDEKDYNEELFAKFFASYILGASPDREISENELEYIKLLAPIFLADSLLVKDHKFLKNDELNVSLTTVYCKEDAVLTEEDVKSWSSVTKSYQHLTVPGVHAEIRLNPTPFIEILKSVVIPED